MDRERVFHALADPTRQTLLDRILAQSGQSVAELADGLGMSRQAVAKHLLVLEHAEMVVTRRTGRVRRHYLNPLPFRAVAGRWLRKFEKVRLSDLMAEDE